MKKKRLNRRLMKYGFTKECQESMRILANYVVKLNKPKICCLGFTSYCSGQGKTYTVQNLGVMLAKLGAKTLVIDANIFSPEITKLTWGDQELGFVQFIDWCKDIDCVDQMVENTAQAYVYDTEIDGLFIMPVGQKGGGLEEYNITWINNLHSFDILKNNYDYILVELPSFEHFSYTQMISEMLDGCLFVYRCGELDSTHARSVKEQIQNLECEVYGCILNMNEHTVSTIQKKKDMPEETNVDSFPTAEEEAAVAQSN